MVLKSNILRTLNPNPSMTAEQRKLYQNPEAVRKILKDTQTIAVVGLSAKPYKASYSVANYMHAAGYRIIPVNPQVDRVLGEKSYPSLSDIPEHIDLVDIFRPPADCLDIVKEAITCKAGAVWLQLEIISPEAAELAKQAGMPAIMDLCFKIEHRRYQDELD